MSRALRVAAALLPIVVASAGCGGKRERTPAPPDGSVACTATGPGVRLVCEPDVAATCTAARTSVDVPSPRVDTSCGGTASGVPTSDAPAGGFVVGDTSVTFTVAADRGDPATCMTHVHVTDDTAPVLSCPPSATVVRGSATIAAAPPSLSATDACDDMVAVSAEPPSLARGMTMVRYTATDGAANTTSCSTAVTIAWEPSGGEDATGYRVERATTAEGPWTALASLSADALYYTDEALPGTIAHYRVVTLAGAEDGGASAPVRALAVAATGYDLRDQSVPTLSFLTTLYGVVRHPADSTAGPFPLVLMLHGNHGNCRRSATSTTDECGTTTTNDCPFSGWVTTPNAEGLAYLGETLAAQGYVAVSVSANALNCRDDYLLERGQLLLEHLRRWRAWATAGGAPFGSMFAGVVDTSRVGLVGHSRGGEAVGHVPAQLRVAPIDGVRVASVFAIAPTDYHDPTPTGVAYAVLLPACDGDVATLEGMAAYDRGLGGTDANARAQVLFVRANHNYFNTEWREDDNASGVVCNPGIEIGTRAQQSMLETTLSAWLAGTLSSDGPVEPFIRADAPTPRGIDAWAASSLDLRWSYASATRTRIDDFSGAGAPYTNWLGQPNTFTSYYVARACTRNDCDRDFDHERSAAFLSWTDAAGVASSSIGLGALDASGYRVISFRVTSRRSTLNDGKTDQDFVIRVADGDGSTAELLLSEAHTLPHLYPTNIPREILQTVRIPLATLAEIAPDVDVRSLSALELHMMAPGYTTGSVLVTDIELARD